MLVLSRKLNETIIIGDDIRVTLLGIDGDKIKIGVDAPRDVKVFREELIEATKSTNKQAVTAPIVSFDLSKMKRSAAKEAAKETAKETAKEAAKEAAKETAKKE